MKRQTLILVLSLFSFCALNAQIYNQIEYWSQIAKVLPEPYENPQFCEFGSSVDVSGNYAVVGEQGYFGYTGCAYVLYYNGSAWEKVAKLSPSDSVIGKYFGNKVSIDGNTIVVGAYKDNMKGTDAGAIYVFEKPATGWIDTTETAKLAPKEINGADNFGCSVDISGDVIVAGALGYMAYKGGAFVYEKPATGWADTTKPVASLITTDLVQWDYLGTSVAIFENTIAVGAKGDDDKGSNSGSVYIYEKPDGGWKDTTQTGKLTASDGAASDYIGNDLSMSGNTLVAGTVNSASVYVFEKPATGWTDGTQTAILTASDLTSGDEFGSSVYISGNTIVVGAKGDDDTKYNIGSVYLYEKPASGWTNGTQKAKLESSVQVADNNLGNAVCISNNMVLAGAFQSDEVNTNTGSVLIFNKPASGWVNATESGKILPETFMSNTYDYFGSAIALVDSTIAIVGSRGYNNNSGCIYIFKYDGSNWNKILQIKDPDGKKNDYFGSDLEVSGNILAVAAEGAGTIHVFENNGNWTNLTHRGRLKPSVKTTNQYFGRSVAIENNTIVVGAFGMNSYKGAVYVYEKPASGWTNASESAILTSSDIADNDYFGYNVDVRDDVIIASAINDDTKGSAYVFTKPATGWVSSTQTAKLRASDGASNDNFGYRVAISKGVIVVSAYTDDAGNGSVYVFEKPETGWTDTVQSVKLKASDASTSDYFGCSLDIEGDVIIIGSKGQDYGSFRSCGSVYFFEKPANNRWIDATQKSQLFAKDVAESDAFGYAVTVLGNYALVSAINKDDNGTNTGSVYMVERNRPITIISKPANMYNVCKDGEVKFSYTAGNAKKYQWYSSVGGSDYSWVPEKYPFSGTTTNTLSFTAHDTLVGRVFICMISNPVYDYIDFKEKFVFTLDTLAPVFTSGVSNTELQADENNKAILPDYTTSIPVTDNCSIKLYSQFPAAGTVINADTDVTLTATDELGNISEESFKVVLKAYDPNNPVNGVLNSNTNNLMVYPNPTSGLINIISRDSQIQRIELCDLTGKTIFIEEDFDSRKSINISSFNGQVFILKIHTNSKILIQKILKQ